MKKQGRTVCVPAVPPIAGGLFALFYLRRMLILLKHQCSPRFALAGAIDDIHGRYNVSHVAAKAILNWALNAPGMSVVVDVWLGPGAYELLLRTLR